LDEDPERRHRSDRGLHSLAAIRDAGITSKDLRTLRRQLDTEPEIDIDGTMTDEAIDQRLWR
jgi:hypothetical protein